MPPLMTPERFWAKVHQPQEADACWEWQGGRHDDGYGRAGYANVLMLTHRLAWIFTHGTIPDGAYVLHQCDNPPCVRPSHLYLGTQRENMRDRKERERFLGADMPNARWTPEQVLAMRRAYGAGEAISSLAQRYGVGDARMSEIVHGKAYTHVPGATGNVGYRHGEDSPSHKLTEQAVREIRAIWETRTSSVKGLAQRYGVSYQTMRALLTGKTWKHLA